MKDFAKLFFERYTSDFSQLPVEKLKSLLRVKAQTILPSLDDVFSKPERVKLGIDPTAADIHIGHLCPLMVLNIFAKAGHHVDFVIGDFTSKIGDPSGRVAERAMLTDAQIAENYKTYTVQAGRYVDMNKFTVRKNGEWLGKMTLADFLGVQGHINAATVMQRDDFRKRLETTGVTMRELAYSTLQGLDSVALNSTIELGGVDQLLNLQSGREIQRIHNQPAQVIITTPLLLGIDGRKMSKTYNNYIALSATSEDKFGKIMAIADDLIMQYYKSFTYVFEDELPELGDFIKTNPMEAKKQLGTYFVAIEAKNIQAGQTERAKFEKKFSKRELTEGDFTVVSVKQGTTLLDALIAGGKFKSKAELKRLLQSGAVRNLDDNSVIAVDVVITNTMKVKVGKLNFFEIIC